MNLLPRRFDSRPGSVFTDRAGGKARGGRPAADPARALPPARAGRPSCHAQPAERPRPALAACPRPGTACRIESDAPAPATRVAPLCEAEQLAERLESVRKRSVRDVYGQRSTPRCHPANLYETRASKHRPARRSGPHGGGQEYHGRSERRRGRAQRCVEAHAVARADQRRTSATDEQRQRPLTSPLRRDFLLAGADEVGEDVRRHRTIGRETDLLLATSKPSDRSLTASSAAGLNGKTLRCFFAALNPEQRATGVDERGHAVARALLGIRRKSTDDRPHAFQRNPFRRRQVSEVVIHRRHAQDHPASSRRLSLRCSSPCLVMRTRSFQAIARAGRGRERGAASWHA